jgi:hypothetical protein
MTQLALPNFELGAGIFGITLTILDGPIFGLTFDETSTLETITGYLSNIAGALFSTDSILYDLLYATGLQRFFLTLTQSLTPS